MTDVRRLGSIVYHMMSLLALALIAAAGARECTTITPGRRQCSNSFQTFIFKTLPICQHQAAAIATPLFPPNSGCPTSQTLLEQPFHSTNSIISELLRELCFRKCAPEAMWQSWVYHQLSLDPMLLFQLVFIYQSLVSQWI